jgi:hypothetical protein
MLHQGVGGGGYQCRFDSGSRFRAVGAGSTLLVLINDGVQRYIDHPFGIDFQLTRSGFHHLLQLFLGFLTNRLDGLRDAAVEIQMSKHLTLTIPADRYWPCLLPLGG